MGFECGPNLSILRRRKQERLKVIRKIAGKKNFYSVTSDTKAVQLQQRPARKNYLGSL